MGLLLDWQCLRHCSQKPEATSASRAYAKFSFWRFCETVVLEIFDQTRFDTGCLLGLIRFWQFMNDMMNQYIAGARDWKALVPLDICNKDSHCFDWLELEVFNKIIRQQRMKFCKINFSDSKYPEPSTFSITSEHSEGTMGFTVTICSFVTLASLITQENNH